MVDVGTAAAEITKGQRAYLAAQFAEFAALDQGDKTMKHYPKNDDVTMRALLRKGILGVGGDWTLHVTPFGRSVAEFMTARCPKQAEEAKG